MMMRGGVTFLTFGFCLMVITNSKSLAEEIPKKVEIDEAQILVSKALHNRELSTLWYEPDISLPFISFSGAGIIDSIDGYWAVNPWTGDVWNLWNCRRPMTPALRKALAKIRERFAAKEQNQYQKLRRLKPDCEFDE